MTVLPVVIALAVAVSSVLLISGVVRLRGRGTPTPVHDVLEGAFLAGGPGRVVDAVIAGMQADGRLTVGGPGIVALRPSDARNAVELAVMQEHATAPSGALHTLRRAVMRGEAVQRVGDALAARGLLIPPAEARPYARWGLIQGILSVIGVPFSFVVAAVLTVNSDPGDGLPLALFALPPLMIVSAFVGLICAGRARSRLTGAGQTALKDFALRDPSSTDPARLVATGGLRALPDEELRQQLGAASRVRPEDALLPTAIATATVTTWCAGATPGAGCGASTDRSSHGGHGGGCAASGGCGGGGSDGGASSCGGGSSCGGSSSSCGGGGGGCGGGGS
ncbi:TIGR04222 domain-containing membrane protein [Streptomyces sp. NBC_01317]|uniref:TIGR04222 domain-containing membrane protein n=1 Tax=Streptomyces sp. NBC_01317 TaxID=2903822 RepID=UPI002E1632C1|nr:TIGR04222 domain-containing membrane protein [Streptomyces sp. NBC_01317]